MAFNAISYTQKKRLSPEGTNILDFFKDLPTEDIPTSASGFNSATPALPDMSLTSSGNSNENTSQEQTQNTDQVTQPTQPTPQDSNSSLGGGFSANFTPPQINGSIDTGIDMSKMAEALGITPQQLGSIDLSKYTTGTGFDLKGLNNFITTMGWNKGGSKLPDFNTSNPIVDEAAKGFKYSDGGFSYDPTNQQAVDLAKTMFGENQYTNLAQEAIDFDPTKMISDKLKEGIANVGYNLPTNMGDAVDIISAGVGVNKDGQLEFKASPEQVNGMVAQLGTQFNIPGLKEVTDVLSQVMGLNPMQMAMTALSATVPGFAALSSAFMAIPGMQVLIPLIPVLGSMVHEGEHSAGYFKAKERAVNAAVQQYQKDYINKMTSQPNYQASFMSDYDNMKSKLSWNQAEADDDGHSQDHRMAHSVEAAKLQGELAFMDRVRKADPMLAKAYANRDMATKQIDDKMKALLRSGQGWGALGQYRALQKEKRNLLTIPYEQWLSYTPTPAPSKMKLS